MKTYKHLVAVYGTLKRGHSRYSYLQNQRYLGIGITEPLYKIYQLSGHPALVQVKESVPSLGNSVYCELYEVDEECLKKLDIVESVSHGLYERKYIKFKEINLAFLPTDEKVFEDCQKRQAEGYFYKKSVEGAKDCGDFWCKSSSLT